MMSDDENENVFSDDEAESIFDEISNALMSEKFMEIPREWRESQTDSLFRTIYYPSREWWPRLRGGLAVADFVRAVSYLLENLIIQAEESRPAFIGLLYYRFGARRPKEEVQGHRKPIPSLFHLIKKAIELDEENVMLNLRSLRDTGVSSELIRIVLDSLKLTITTKDSKDFPELLTDKEAPEVDPKVTDFHFELELLKLLFKDNSLLTLVQYRNTLSALQSDISFAEQNNEDSSRLRRFRLLLFLQWSARYQAIIEDMPGPQISSALMVVLEIATMLPYRLAVTHLHRSRVLTNNLITTDRFTADLGFANQIRQLLHSYFDLCIGSRNYALAQTLLKLAPEQLEFGDFPKSIVVEMLQWMPNLLRLMRSWAPPSSDMSPKPATTLVPDDERHMLERLSNEDSGFWVSDDLKEFDNWTDFVAHYANGPVLFSCSSTSKVFDTHAKYAEHVLTQVGAKHMSLELFFDVGARRMKQMCDAIDDPRSTFYSFMEILEELLLIMLVQPTDIECLDLIVKAFSHIVEKINVRKTLETNLIIRTHFDQICEVLQHFLALCPSFQDKQDVHRVLLAPLNHFLRIVVPLVMKALGSLPEASSLGTITDLFVASAVRLGIFEDCGLAEALTTIAQNHPHVIAKSTSLLLKSVRHSKTYSLLSVIAALPFSYGGKLLSSATSVFVGMLARTTDQLHCDLVQHLLLQIAKNNPAALRPYMTKLCSLYFDASEPLILPPPAVPAGGAPGEGKDPTADALGALRMRRDDTMIDTEEMNRLTDAAKKALEELENGTAADPDRSPSLRGAYGAVVGPNGVAFDTLPLVFRYYALLDASVFEKHLEKIAEHMSHLHQVANFMPLVAVVADSSSDEAVRRRCHRVLMELIMRDSYASIQSSNSPDEIRLFGLRELMKAARAHPKELGDYADVFEKLKKTPLREVAIQLLLMAEGKDPCEDVRAMFDSLTQLRELSKKSPVYEDVTQAKTGVILKRELVYREVFVNSEDTGAPPNSLGAQTLPFSDFSDPLLSYQNAQQSPWKIDVGDDVTEYGLNGVQEPPDRRMSRASEYSVESFAAAPHQWDYTSGAGPLFLPQIHETAHTRPLPHRSPIMTPALPHQHQHPHPHLGASRQSTLGRQLPHQQPVNAHQRRASAGMGMWGHAAAAASVAEQEYETPRNFWSDDLTSTIDPALVSDQAFPHGAASAAAFHHAQPDQSGGHPDRNYASYFRSIRSSISIPPSSRKLASGDTAGLSLLERDRLEMAGYSQSPPPMRARSGSSRRMMSTLGRSKTNPATRRLGGGVGGSGALSGGASPVRIASPAAKRKVSHAALAGGFGGGGATQSPASLARARKKAARLPPGSTPDRSVAAADPTSAGGGGSRSTTPPVITDSAPGARMLNRTPSVEKPKQVDSTPAFATLKLRSVKKKSHMRDPSLPEFAKVQLHQISPAATAEDDENNVPQEWGVKRVDSAVRDKKQYVEKQREEAERERELAELRQPPVELRDDSDSDDDGFKTPKALARRRIEKLKTIVDDKKQDGKEVDEKQTPNGDADANGELKEAYAAANGDHQAAVKASALNEMTSTSAAAAAKKSVREEDIDEARDSTLASLPEDDDDLSDVDELYNFPMPSETDIDALYGQSASDKRGGSRRGSKRGSAVDSRALSIVSTTSSKRGSHVARELHVTDLAEDSEADSDSSSAVSIEPLSDDELTFKGIDPRLLKRHGRRSSSKRNSSIAKRNSSIAKRKKSIAKKDGKSTAGEVVATVDLSALNKPTSPSSVMQSTLSRMRPPAFLNNPKSLNNFKTDHDLLLERQDVKDDEAPPSPLMSSSLKLVDMVPPSTPSHKAAPRIDLDRPPVTSIGVVPVSTPSASASSSSKGSSWWGTKRLKYNQRRKIAKRVKSVGDVVAMTWAGTIVDAVVDAVCDEVVTSEDFDKGKVEVYERISEALDSADADISGRRHSTGGVSSPLLSKLNIGRSAGHTRQNSRHANASASASPRNALAAGGSGGGGKKAAANLDSVGNISPRAAAAAARAASLASPSFARRVGGALARTFHRAARKDRVGSTSDIPPMYPVLADADGEDGDLFDGETRTSSTGSAASSSAGGGIRVRKRSQKAYLEQERARSEREMLKLKKKRKDKAGWLYKKNPRGLRGMRKWRRRWCVIRPNRFEYYEKKEDALPRGVIELQEVLEVDRLNSDRKNQNRFQIIVSKCSRVYEFRTDNRAYCDEWILMLRERVHSKKLNDLKRAKNADPKNGVAAAAAAPAAAKSGGSKANGNGAGAVSRGSGSTNSGKTGSVSVSGETGEAS